MLFFLSFYFSWVTYFCTSWHGSINIYSRDQFIIIRIITMAVDTFRVLIFYSFMILVSWQSLDAYLIKTFIEILLRQLGSFNYIMTKGMNCAVFPFIILFILFSFLNLRGWLGMGIEDYSKPFTSDYLLKKEITYSKEWFDFESFNLFLVNNSWHVKKKSWIMELMNYGGYAICGKIMVTVSFRCHPKVTPFLLSLMF